MARTATATDTRPIFISYRRDDTSGYAGRLADDLSEMFGEEHVFRDVIKIEPGRDYLEVIDDALDRCSAMVVVIGREWVDSVDATGRRRLDKPDDVLRLEVTAALERNTLVIPVLVEDARMPGPQELPEPLHGLSRRQAIALTDTNWDHDLARLAAAIESAPGAPSRRRRTGAMRWQGIPTPVLAGVGVVVLALVVLGVRWLTSDGSGPQPMTGRFNIAVADFGALDSDGRVVTSGAASQLSTRFRQLLELDVKAVDGGRDVQHQGVGRLRGGTVDERAAAAERVARDIGADVVVYGVIQSDSGASVLTPEFYVTDRLLFDSSEVVGHHLLGSPISVPGDAQRTAVQNELIDQLGARSRVLAESIVALGYSSVDNFPAALDHLTAAEQLPGWAPERGKEVLYLLLGNAAGKVGRLADAERHYDRALALSPTYSRASLGKAEVIYHRARGDCVTIDVDASGLQRSLEIYGNARSGRLPAGADVPAKAAMGEGRVLVCMSQSLLSDRWADAESRFLQVIQAYGGRNVRLRELAAEAHAELGWVYRPFGPDEPGARDKYLRAADEYETAIELYKETGRRRDRQAFFHSQLDYLYTRVGDLARADVAHEEAIRLAPDAATVERYQKAHDQDRAVKP